MEDLLDLYAEAYDPGCPVICFDEKPQQLIGETRVPLPAKSGHPQRYDFEYKRNGICNLFIFFEPHTGQRHVKMTKRRTKLDFVLCMRDAVDQLYPEAERFRLVLDNLNTHTPGSLYEAFAPAEARRIMRRLEFHYTPKHASWLNMVEIELSTLSRQCLNRRIADKETLQAEIQAWQAERNRSKATVHWRFTNSSARQRFRSRYLS